MEVYNKVVLITGASEGIGKATALLFARQGAKVALAARSEEKLGSIAKEMNDPFVVPTDMTRTEEVREMVRRTRAHYGRLDVLINNAGQGMYCPVELIKLEDFDHLMRLNLFGPLTAMQEAIPIMREQGSGSIINVSSIVSKTALPYVGGYASTKYALNGITLTAREELAKDGIVVSLVLPGATATEFPQHTHHTEEMLKLVRGKVLKVDSAEKVAENILVAVQTGVAEQYV